MEAWDNAIYGIIKKSKNHFILLNDIYEQMKIHPLVTPYHREPWKPGGQPRYQCWVRRRLTSLTRKNMITRVARASYSLK